MTADGRRVATLATLLMLGGGSLCLLPPSSPAPGPVPGAPGAAARITPPEGAAAVRAYAGECRDATGEHDGTLRALADSDDPLTAAHAIAALGRLGRLGPADPLLGRLADGPLRVRHELVLALGRSGDARHVPRLSTLLRDPDPDTRRLAAMALGRLGERAPLQALLDDPHTDARDRAFARAALRPPARPPLLASSGR